MIIMRCSNPMCRRVMELPDHARGKKVQCKVCGTTSKVPMTRMPKPKSPTKIPDPPSQASDE